MGIEEGKSALFTQFVEIEILANRMRIKTTFFPMSNHPLLKKMLMFIEDYQQNNPDKSSREIVRELRSYTRPRYASRFWELVAGDNPDFVRGELDSEQVIIAGQEIDFAHFIAVLSDQFPGGNLASTLADGFFWLQSLLLEGMPYDSREFTSAIGDTAQAIETYISRHGMSSYQPDRLANLLRIQASEIDYASDLTAFMAGAILQKNPQVGVSDAIAEVDTISYEEIVKRYLQDSLGAKFDGSDNQIQNLDQVKSRISKRIGTYLLYKQDLWSGNIFNSNYRQQVRPTLIAAATEHFLNYLLNYLLHWGSI